MTRWRPSPSGTDSVNTTAAPLRIASTAGVGAVAAGHAEEGREDGVAERLVLVDDVAEEAARPDRRGPPRRGSSPSSRRGPRPRSAGGSRARGRSRRTSPSSGVIIVTGTPLQRVRGGEQVEVPEVAGAGDDPLPARDRLLEAIPPLVDEDRLDLAPAGGTGRARSPGSSARGCGRSARAIARRSASLFSGNASRRLSSTTRRRMRSAQMSAPSAAPKASSQRRGIRTRSQPRSRMGSEPGSRWTRTSRWTARCGAEHRAERRASRRLAPRGRSPPRCGPRARAGSRGRVGAEPDRVLLGRDDELAARRRRRRGGPPRGPPPRTGGGRGRRAPRRPPRPCAATVRRKPTGRAMPARRRTRRPRSASTPTAARASPSTTSIGGVARLDRLPAGRLAGERRGARRARRVVRLVHAREPDEAGASQRRARLAVRAGGEEPAVAERVRGVEHHHVEVARERAVLEAVVEEERVRAEVAPRRCARAPRGAGRTARGVPGSRRRDEHRLVAAVGRVEQEPRAVRDDPRVGPRRAVAAREHGDPPPAREQPARDRHRDRRLARARPRRGSRSRRPGPRRAPRGGPRAS